MELTLNRKKNSSLQPGDSLYYADVINGVTAKPEYWGVVSSIHDETEQGYTITTSNHGASLVQDYASIINSNTYFLFSKPIKANESSIKGYYANVTLQNHSKKRAELFAIGSEIVVSSK
tara:strand:- start:192 stop:548 length:357 start_codon:yes stop_codon:yes gene_type:complete